MPQACCPSRTAVRNGTYLPSLGKHPCELEQCRAVCHSLCVPYPVCSHPVPLFSRSFMEPLSNLSTHLHRLGVSLPTYKHFVQQKVVILSVSEGSQVIYNLCFQSSLNIFEADSKFCFVLDFADTRHPRITFEFCWQGLGKHKPGLYPPYLSEGDPRHPKPFS